MENENWRDKYYNLYNKYVKIKNERDIFRMLTVGIITLVFVNGIVYLYKHYFALLNIGDKIAFGFGVLSVIVILIKVWQWGYSGTKD